MGFFKTGYILRYAQCAALLALLVVSSSAADRQAGIPAVPVLLETVSEGALTAQTLEQTRERLARRREEALMLVQSVLDDPDAAQASRDKALDEKLRIAGCMETEAAIETLLQHMGFAETVVVAGEQALSIIAPWQAAENEQNRVKIIDAAVSQSGFSADAVKIILAKK